jgi:hypothetical protein
MFNFVVQAIQAYNQIGYFVGAVVLLGLGGLILANSLYWRIQSVRVRGVIAGVIDRGGNYTPVYQYTAPNGSSYKAKSDTSSGSTRGKETGRRVSLLISAHDPTQAREANDFLLDIIGILLVAPGFLFGYLALTAYPVTWVTWLMAAAMIGYLAERAYRILIPKGQRVSISDVLQQHGSQNASLDLTALKPIEQIVDSRNEQDQFKQERANKRRAAPIVAIFAAVLFAAGIYQARNVAQLAASGIRSPGEVVRLASQSGKGGYTYYPIVRFRTGQNDSIEFRDSIGSSPPMYRTGDKVAVLYLSSNPRGSAVIDHGTFWNWLIPALLLAAAALLLWLLLSMLRGNDSGRIQSGAASVT